MCKLQKSSPPHHCYARNLHICTFFILGFTYGKPWVYLRQTPGLLTAKSYNKRTVCYTRAVISASQYGRSEKFRAVNFYSRNAKIYNVRANKFNTDITPSKKIVRKKLIPWVLSRVRWFVISIIIPKSFFYSKNIIIFAH